MGNAHFRFKQFTIHQDQCAMKVSTDACILGAWFAAKVPDISTILDVGSGTGLLMMMLAQKTNSEIHGIEIDLAAFRQLKENINQNQWKESLKVFPGDARSFIFPAKYDFIIANPPFFENDLEPETETVQVAKHSKMLSLHELIQVFNKNLQLYGAFGLLLPAHRWKYFDGLASAAGFSLVERLMIKQTPAHDHFRAVLHYSRNKENFAPSFELVIQKPDGSYSDEFVELLKDYYLYL